MSTQNDNSLIQAFLDEGIVLKKQSKYQLNPKTAGFEEIIEVEALKIENPIGLNANIKSKFYSISNIETSGVTAPVWMHLFYLVAQHEGFEAGNVEEYEVPLQFADTLGVGDIITLTFAWKGMLFRNARIVIQPGYTYCLPTEIIQEIKRLVTAKTLDPALLGLKQSTKAGYKGAYQLTDEQGQQVRISDIDQSIFTKKTRLY